MKLIKFIFSLLIILNSICSYSQVITRKTIKINRIKNLIDKANHDTVKIKLLKQWADIAFLSNFDEDLRIQEEIISICEHNLEKKLEKKTKKAPNKAPNEHPISTNKHQKIIKIPNISQK